MNYFTKKLSWLLMSLMLVVSGNVWADEISFTPGTVNGTTTDQTADEMSSGGITFSCTSAALGRTDNYRFYLSSTTTVSSTVGNITKVVFTCNSNDYASTLKNATFSEGEVSKNAAVVTWTGNTSSFTFKPAAQVRVDNIVVTVEEANINAPTFSPVGGTYTEAQSVTISCATDGASIYYTTDGSEPTTSSTKYTGAITVSQTTTLKAIASNGTETSSVATATYTILSSITIAEARTQGTGDVITSGVVTSFSTANSGNTAYIQDATAGICVYGNVNLTVGDEISVQGTLNTYRGLLEITNPTCTVISSGNTVTPTVKTIAEINSDNTLQGILVKIENATVTAISGQSTTIEQDGNSIVVRGISGVDYAVDDVITLTGNVGCFDNAQIANPTDVTVTKDLTPKIVVSTTSIELTAAEKEGTINVEYTNVEDADIQFVAADGTTSATYNWIVAEINSEGNIDYIVEKNTGAEARTAYFKVYGLDNSANYVYSELITISQDAPVADFATLPFEFDEGRAAIEKTAGLTQEGIDTDYSSSPKLKFNTTGDWLILQFDERPGTLSFDIKGNAFSDGSFTVQTSEDGVTYTDLETYTELGTTQSEKFDNLGENVRFIKWIYTEKVNGNVALGNIKLNKYVEALPYTLTITPNENAEIFAFYNDPDNNWPDIQSGDEVLANSSVMISVSANEGYQLEGVTVTTEDGQEVPLTEEEEGISWTFTMPASNVTVSCTCTKEEPFEPTTYTLVTSTDELSAGDEIIIVNTTAGVALSTEQKKNNRGEVAISIDESDPSTIIITQKEVQVLTLETSDDNWLLNTGAGYLYAASSDNNYLRTEAEPDNNGNAAASIVIYEEGDATIIFQGTYKRNELRYNDSSLLFSCYASTSSTGVPVQIYKKVTSVVSLKGDANGDGSVDISDVVAVVNYILNGEETSGNFVFDNADVDNSKSVDISDVVGIVNIILNGE